MGLGRALPAWLVFLLAMLACQPAQTRSNPDATGRTAITAQAGSSLAHDLSQDESAGGHTLRKHVGQTDEELRDRLRHEPHISAASTWTDRPTAEHAVALALEQNRDKINRWVNRSGGHPNLVVDYEGHRERPFGRSLRRGEDHAEPCARATIVLRWAAGPSDYFVLTSYPECHE